jgi:anti-sigma regulatory factor (Ser/Thr protein kinase)
VTRCVLSQRVPPFAENIGDIRRAVQACAAEHGVVDPGAVALAFSEALTNAVLHAYVDVEPRDVEVLVELAADTVVITVADRGRGMQPRPDSPGLGLGLPLISSLTRRFDVEQRPEGGARLTLWFDRT